MSSYRDSTTLMTKEGLMHFLTQIFQNHFFFFFYQKFFQKLQTLKNNFLKNRDYVLVFFIHKYTIFFHNVWYHLQVLFFQ